jgi:hypothetical protein
MQMILIYFIILTSKHGSNFDFLNDVAVKFFQISRKYSICICINQFHRIFIKNTISRQKREIFDNCLCD